MTFNFMSSNLLSRTLTGTVTLVAILGMIPGIVLASSKQPFAPTHQLRLKSEDNINPADITPAELERLLGGENLETLEVPEFFKELADPMYQEGNALMEQGDFEGAILQYNLALTFYSQYAEAYTNRAIAKAQLGDESGAIADLEQAATLFQEQGNTQAYQQIQQVLQQAQ